MWATNPTERCIPLREDGRVLRCSPWLQIGLGAHNDTWDGVEATEVDDLLIYYLHHVKGLAGGDGVDQYVAMGADSVLRVENGVLVLPTGFRMWDGRREKLRTWPAVSTMSQSYSTSLYLILLENVLSMVG